METFIKQITTIALLLALLTTQSVFAVTYQTPDTVALFETSLASRITDTATSMTLTSATTKDGSTLATSTYGFIIDEGTASEEIVLADCTATVCTNMVRGVSVLTGTSSISALKKEHRRGSSVKMTDAPILIFINNILKARQNLENALTYDSALSIATSSNKLVYANWVNDKILSQALIKATSTTQTVSGPVIYSASTTFATTTFDGTVTLNQLSFAVLTPTSATHIANKAYVDGVATSGAANADTTTKGVVEEATDAEVAAGTATGGTGARLYINPASAAQLQPSIYFSTSTGNNKLVGQIPVTANDIITMWADSYQSDDCTDALRLTGTLYFKASAGSPTTTVSSKSMNGTGTTDACLVSAIGYLVATSTATTTITWDMEDGGAAGAIPTYSSLLIQVINR